MKKILYIEDEEFLGKIVRDAFVKEGYSVLWLKDGTGVTRLLEEFAPDICIVDIMLPNIDGYTISKNIKGLYPRMPVIFLTAKGQTGDVLKGFDHGGTDYIKKPFSLEELVARIENQLNLHGESLWQKKPASMINIGSYTFYPGRFELSHDGIIVRLSNRDTEVLSILAANKNGVVDRKDLLISIWGDDSFFNSRNLDVYIRKLRKYLSGDPEVQIKTLRGKGYILSDQHS